MKINKQTTIKEILELPAFKDVGKFLFPLQRPIRKEMTLEELSSPNIYVWYSCIQVSKTIEIIESLYKQAQTSPIFYLIYSEDEIRKDVSKQNVGVFFFKGKKDAPFAICNAGGGFAYVGAMHDSFPHALELSKLGYNAFALIYRVNHAYEDLAHAITYILSHSKELEVNDEHYSLWGGSAGARMAAQLGNKEVLNYYVGHDVIQADAVIMQYTGYDYVSIYDAPTYMNVGTQDYIADYRIAEERLNRLRAMGISTEFHSYPRLSHGFGLGQGTVAEGWIKDAVIFWQKQIDKH